MTHGPMNISASLDSATYLLAALVLIGSCRSGKLEDGKASASRGDSLSDSSSLARDTIAASEKVASRGASAHSDSTSGFDPDGYYVVKDPPTINGRKISWLELQARPPEVTMSLSIPGSTKHSRHSCVVGLITVDSLSANCGATPIGYVTVNGHFLDKSGSYSDKLAYENKPTVLLVARMVVTKDGRIMYDGVHRFTYSAGG
jgi:hypothetical protein